MIEDTNNEATQADDTPTDQPNESSAPANNAAPVDLDAVAEDAFQKGVDELDPNAPKDAADVAAQAQAPGAPAPAGVDPAKAVPEVKVPPVVSPPAPDAAVEKEIKDLGLKAKAAERFREAATKIATFEKEIEPLKAAKQQLDEWNGFLAASTVSPQQLGAMVEVGKALNGNDLAKKGVAFDTMLTTLVELGKQLGREVPGLVDPLDAHPDLKAAVENGEITPELAKQHASQRAALKHSERVTHQQTEQQQHQQEVQTANQQLAALGANLKNGNAALGVAPDPFFEVKMQMLAPALEVIQNSLPPSKWAEAAARAYGQLPQPSTVAPVPVPGARKPPAVGHMPVRPGNSGAALRPKPRSDEEAFEMGAYGGADG